MFVAPLVDLVSHHPVHSTHSAVHRVSSAPSSQAIQVRSLVVDGEPVNEVIINVRDPHIEVQPAIANHELGTTATLAQIAQQNHAIAAINGTFFDAGGDNFPAGALELNGQFVYNDKGTLLGIGTQGQLTMLRATEELSLNVYDPANTISNMWPWFLNTLSTNPMRVSVLTPFYGPRTRESSSVVAEVENNKIVAIHDGITPIPSNGYDIEIGAGEAKTPIMQRVHVGDRAVWGDTVVSLDTGKTVPFTAYPNAIGAGPMLLNNGRIDIEPAKEGLDNYEVVDAVTLRSVVGFNSSGQLVFLTIHDANVDQEAQIAKALGLTYAMNLDGGSSTGLWYEGRYLTVPQRTLATAIVVEEK
ncbi:phosphodiester glycosidase family protein [Alicyclobacillus mali (ex Roth et al. 2021)]|uniref:phosphodiester glycosidase family protein n=1 Tax=Alicyclobacillus mali (ex Roth et al. 2021) TaxID=1123961 RepID=UPI001E33C511|nr:phosphodiester glycosidase family protein [Alicyclobacillus mali (ex Roth et al. 2021)]